MARPLWLLVTLAACSYQNGALLEVSGDIEFDQVDVYFGNNVGDRVPRTPKRPAAAPPEEIQQLVERTYSMYDQWGPKAPRKSWSYFLPSVDRNLELGDYVLVLVSKEGSPKGVGEYFDFAVPEEQAIYKVEIPLSRVDEGVETWGAQRDCVRWTRSRDGQPSTVAVVRRRDHDCDDFGADQTRDDADCDELRYCDGSGTAMGGCIGETPCLVDLQNTCTTGTCANSTDDGRICTATTATCVERDICKCALDDPDPLIECAAAGAHLAADYGIPVKDDDTLCTEPAYDLTVKMPFPCLDPHVQAEQNSTSGAVTNFTFDIRPATTANACVLMITENEPGARLVGVPHLLISLAAPQGSQYARLEFVLGIMPGPPCNNSEQSITLTENPLLGCGV